MEIKHDATAGTLESSDVMVTVEPGSGGVEVQVESPVLHQFGAQISRIVLESLERLDVKSVRVSVLDRGALDCTIKARVEAAVFRAADASEEGIPWGGAVK